MGSDVKILLVGSHAILMGSVAARLEYEHHCSVVGLVATPPQAVEMLAEQAADILIMDIDGTVMDCLTYVERWRGACPSLRIILLGSRLADTRIEHFLNAGVNGILLKGDLPVKIGTAIREVHAGGSYVPEDVRSRIIVESGGIRLSDHTSTN